MTFLSSFTNKLVLNGELPTPTPFNNPNSNSKKIIRPKIIIHCKSSYNSDRGDPNDEGYLSKSYNVKEALLSSSLSPLTIAISSLSNVYSNLLRPPLHPSVDPKQVLTGNFAPVGETPPTKCEVVKGKLPSNINGVYMRNGPNPQYEPIGPHHFFEGDGMIHSIRLSDGQATFCSRYIKTYKYNLEKIAGAPFIPNFFSGSYGLLDLLHIAKAAGKVLVGDINIKEGFGLANTSVAFLFNKLLAMVDNDLPYAFKLTEDSDIETLGRYDFDGKVFTNMSAHPKIDPETGEVFAFRCFPIYPYITFFRFDSNGLKEEHDVPINSIKTPTYIHDFAITKKYAIFPDTQLHMSPMSVVNCKGMSASVNENKVPRIGILPRYATSDASMKWFDVPGFNAFHIVNAWEEESTEDTIVIITPNCLFIENFFSDMRKLHFSLEKLRINMKTGDISRRVISERNLELGSMNSSYGGKKNRYVYMAVGEHVPKMKDVAKAAGGPVPKMKGIVKIDLEHVCEVGCRIYEQGCYGGEAVFVAKEDGDEEDDGYVVSFVRDEIKEESHLLVMDAKSPELEIVAAVKLPGRVPYGIHGLFVSEKDLQQAL